MLWFFLLNGGEQNSFMFLMYNIFLWCVLSVRYLPQTLPR